MSEADIKKFVTFWKGEIAKIEKRAVDSRTVYRIQLDFDDQQEDLKLSMPEREVESSLLELEELESQLQIALGTARSKYDLKNKSLMAKVSESIAKIFYSIADMLRTIFK